MQLANPAKLGGIGESLEYVLLGGAKRNTIEMTRFFDELFSMLMPLAHFSNSVAS